jgi:hypothetical protein
VLEEVSAIRRRPASTRARKVDDTGQAGLYFVAGAVTPSQHQVSRTAETPAWIVGTVDDLEHVQVLSGSKSTWMIFFYEIEETTSSPNGDSLARSSHFPHFEPHLATGASSILISWISHELAQSAH